MRFEQFVLCFSTTHIKKRPEFRRDGGSQLLLLRRSIKTEPFLPPENSSLAIDIHVYQSANMVIATKCTVWLTIQDLTSTYNQYKPSLYLYTILLAVSASKHDNQEFEVFQKYIHYPESHLFYRHFIVILWSYGEEIQQVLSAISVYF